MINQIEKIAVLDEKLQYVYQFELNNMQSRINQRLRNAKCLYIRYWSLTNSMVKIGNSNPHNTDRNQAIET